MNIKGVEELARALRKGADIRDVANAVKVNGAEMHAKAQRYAPVDTGNLKRGIKLTMSDGGFTATVDANDISYSVYQEYGTRYQSGTPFIRPAFHEQERSFLSDLDRLLE